MLSFAEVLQVDCPRCKSPFEAETWVIVDGQERPDLLARIRDGSLHDIECPTCGQRGIIPAPILYHDAAQRRVLLAVPPGMDEEQWREAGQTLLWSLIGALPEEQRLPYLGDVQAEQGLEGIVQVLEAEQLSVPADASDETPPIVLAVEAILQARTPPELQQVLREHPLLTTPQAVAILRELAHTAFQQGEEAAGTGFSRAADIVVELQALAPAIASSGDEAVAGAAPGTKDDVDELAFALLRTQNAADLAAVVERHRELLDDQSDGMLAAWAAAARASQKPNIADGMDERRRALQELRAEYNRQQPIITAVQALLDADSEAAVETAIIEYGELLTPAADDLLARLESEDEPEVAALIKERRALLAQVRTALNVSGTPPPSGG